MELKNPLINIEEFSKAIHAEISQLNYGENPVELYEAIEYMMTLGGKRMRPLFVILGYYLFDENWQKALKPAIAVEIFHNFTLMHDDIMDKAPLRRNKPTVHTKWNENLAILAGDVMMVKAYDLLLEVENHHLKKVLQLFNHCATQVCEGQQLDMNFEKLDTVSEAAYLQMIKLKTAVLLGFSLELGALVAGASVQDAEHLRVFGTSIGIGFQLKDDLLDVYGNKEKFGKQVGGDILANKKTFLLIKALENAQGEQLSQLNHWINATNPDAEEKIKAVTNLYNQLHIKEITEVKIQDFFSEAFVQLDQIKADTDKKSILKQFAQQILEREN